MDEVFADAQVKHLNAAVAVEHPTLGTLTILNQAIKLSRTPGAVVTATPERGEHSDEILGEIGLSATEVAELRESGVIR
jgi:formyl-CoA transferase